MNQDGTCHEAHDKLGSDTKMTTLTLSTTYGESQVIPNDELHQQKFRAREAYMHDAVVHNDSMQAVRDSCINQMADCLVWAVAGECDANPTYMQFHCAPACSSCHMLSYETRCVEDPNAQDVWKPGDLEVMFRRIIEQDSYYQRAYSPIDIVSQPGVINPFTRRDSPWILVLPNFVTSDECETLIQLGHDRGYERSKTVGAGRDEHGTLQHVIDYQGRTSKNAWCLDECYQHPVAQRIIQKLANLTGIDDVHTEYLQLLRYDVGEHYETHHDFVPVLQNGLPGPRILTVFLYLNNVEAGGATTFTDLNITIQPKQGSALIWPSVLNDSPNQKDRRLHHAALAVEQGVKYGANAWVSDSSKQGIQLATRECNYLTKV